MAKINKCIGDDTKAAARQSLNCIKNKTKNKTWRKTIFNMADGMWHVALESWQWIHQAAAPCNVIWDDMPLNSPKRPPYWNSTSGFHFHTSPQSTCTSLRNFIQIGPPSAKNDVMSIFKMADLCHLEFLGSNNGFFEKPMYDFLWVVNNDHSSKLLSFWENRFLAFWRQTDRQTNRQPNRRTNRWTAPMH